MVSLIKLPSRVILCFQIRNFPGGVREQNKGIYETFLPKETIMARTKPYTGGLLVLDLVLTLITGGFWLLVVLFREMWRRN